MKKILSVLLCALIFICGCSKNPDVNKKNDDVKASELLTYEDVVPYLEHPPVLVEENSRRASIATYKSEAVGKEYPVIIKLIQENQLISKEMIKGEFDKQKELRNLSFDVDSLGAECYVSYPSINYYIDGYHVQITAGSGSDNTQKILLMNLAKISLNNLNELTGIVSDL